MSTKTRPTDNLPVLRGTITATWWHRNELQARISVYCPVCRCRHEHSWMMADGPGVLKHRFAHCGGSSPFCERGYLLGVWPNNVPEAAGHLIKPGRKRYGPEHATEPCRCGCQRRPRPDRRPTDGQFASAVESASGRTSLDKTESME